MVGKIDAPQKKKIALVTRGSVVHSKTSRASLLSERQEKRMDQCWRELAGRRSLQDW